MGSVMRKTAMGKLFIGTAFGHVYFLKQEFTVIKFIAQSVGLQTIPKLDLPVASSCLLKTDAKMNSGSSLTLK